VTIDARNFGLSYTNYTQTHTPNHPQTGPITVHRATASAQCNNNCTCSETDRLLVKVTARTFIVETRAIFGIGNRSCTAAFRLL